MTLRTAPGEHAAVVGRVYVPKQASFVRVIGLLLDGRNGGNLPSPTVDGKGDQFISNDVTNYHTAICFELGSGGGYGRALGTLLSHNRIHDCGRLPPTNHDHAIYVANSVGARILDNWIYNNADRGIQLYWNAQRTTIAGNVIDHNGEGIIISGGDGHVSSHNVIFGNVITNPTVRAAVEAYWPSSASGTGNLVVDNCVHGGKKTIDLSAGGFVARRNIDTDPHYANPAAADYSLPPNTTCAQLVGLADNARLRTRAVAAALRRHRGRHHRHRRRRRPQ